MKKQFLYNIILVGALGFSIQNAYAAAAGPDVAEETQAKFFGLRAGIYALHARADHKSVAAAAEFTHIAEELLRVEGTTPDGVTITGVEVVYNFQKHFNLSFEQKCGLMQQTLDVFTPKSMHAVLPMMNGIVPLKSLAITAEQNAAFGSITTRLLSSFTDVLRDTGQVAGIMDVRYAVAAAYGTETLRSFIGELEKPSSTFSSISPVKLNTYKGRACMALAHALTQQEDTTEGSYEALHFLAKAAQVEYLDVLGEVDTLVALLQRSTDQTLTFIVNTYRKDTRGHVLYPLYATYKGVRDHEAADGAKMLERSASLTKVASRHADDEALRLRILEDYEIFAGAIYRKALKNDAVLKTLHDAMSARGIAV